MIMMMIAVGCGDYLIKQLIDWWYVRQPPAFTFLKIQVAQTNNVLLVDISVDFLFIFYFFKFTHTQTAKILIFHV